MDLWAGRLESDAERKGECAMSVLYVVVPLALVLAIAGVWAFVKAARSGQFDDLDTPGWRVVQDDE
jgi:cbb3-type cytochrome oxidase maturation protein